ncbi:MAG: serine hydroxymethyltransferase [Candidatus Nanohalarchaeota archaeon]|nr:MAG: serine hydroxymethyltransferase [Candidatus Nanohaloarchaeota archaeon]
MDETKTINKINELLEEHNVWRKKECLNLIASENVTSPEADRLSVSDLSHRYAEGKPFHRHYQGLGFVDEIEALTQDLMKNLFRAKKVDLRVLSGTLANAAVFKGITNRGDNIISSSIPNGGHVSHTQHGICDVVGLTDYAFPFDYDEMNIDVDKTIKLIEEKNPKILLFGASLFLFPHPVEELADTAKSHDAYVMYDAAHVLGLIAGGRFQDPLKEGADVMSSSTHKTFFGPQGGIIFGGDSLGDEEWKNIENAIFPYFVCNHHLHRLPVLAQAAYELSQYGSDYADQTIKNAKTLAEELHTFGFDCLAEHKGFTQSHQVVLNVEKNGGGKTVAELLEKNNIILNKNFLPGEKITKENMNNPAGIRIGVQEMTRCKMKADEMKHIAELIKKAVVDKKDVKAEVVEFRKNYTEVGFC